MTSKGETNWKCLKVPKYKYYINEVFEIFRFFDD